MCITYHTHTLYTIHRNFMYLQTICIVEKITINRLCRQCIKLMITMTINTILSTAQSFRLVFFYFFSFFLPRLIINVCLFFSSKYSNVTRKIMHARICNTPYGLSHHTHTHRKTYAKLRRRRKKRKHPK